MSKSSFRASSFEFLLSYISKKLFLEITMNLQNISIIPELVVLDSVGIWSLWDGWWGSEGLQQQIFSLGPPHNPAVNRI